MSTCNQQPQDTIGQMSCMIEKSFLLLLIILTLGVGILMYIGIKKDTSHIYRFSLPHKKHNRSSSDIELSRAMNESVGEYEK